MSKKFLSFIILVIFLQCALIWHFGVAKPNLFIDEWWSFNLANGKTPFLTDVPTEMIGTRLSSDFWNGVVTVKWPDLFDFKTVWANQAADVHPPLYYALLHVLCGLHGEGFSMIPALLLNTIFFIGTQFFLYFIVCDITKRRYYGLWAIVFYGFSIGAVSTVLCFRMYMMLAFFVLSSVYFNIKIIEGERRVIWLVCLTVVHIVGFLTQYYYIIYAFFAGIPVLVFLGVHRKYRDVGVYVGLALLSVSLSFAVFPDFVHHIFGSNYRGVEAFSNFASTSFWKRFRELTLIFFRCSGLLYAVYAFIVFAFSWCILRFVMVKFFVRDDGVEIILSGRDKKFLCQPIVMRLHTSGFKRLVLICMFFMTLAVLAKIVPYMVFRYVMPLGPVFVAIVFVFIAMVVDKCIFSEQFVKYATVAVFVLMLAVDTFHPSKIEWYWKDHRNITKVFAEQPNTTFVAIGRDPWMWPLVSQGYSLMRSKQSYFVAETDLSSLSRIPEKERKSLVLWIAYNCRDVNKTREEARHLLGIKGEGHFLYEDHGRLEHHVK